MADEIRREARLRPLDALRGLAALIVLLHHCRQTIPALERVALFHRLAPGSGAVLVFFVLSGLVLGMTFVDRDGGRYLPYAVKRVFRIWPALAAFVLVSATLQLLIGHHLVPGVTATFEGYWSLPLTPAALVAHLGMTGTSTNLDEPIWSLVHEMRVSLVFPALAALVLWDWRAALLGSLALCLLCGGSPGDGALAASLLASARFVVLFVAGAALALRARGLRHELGRAPLALRLPLWALSLGLVAMSADYSSETLTLLGTLRFLLHGAGATLLVALCATVGREDRDPHWLEGPVPQYLGRISYSLYLCHVVVITAVLQAFRDVAPAPVLVVVAALLSIGVAHLGERFVERPFTGLGRRLARALDGRRQLVAGA